MKYSLAKFPSIITALPVMALVAVFAVSLGAAFDKRQEAQRTALA